MSISIDSLNDNIAIRLEKNIHKLKNLVETFKLDKVPPIKVKNDVNKKTFNG